MGLLHIFARQQRIKTCSLQALQFQGLNLLQQIPISRLEPNPQNHLCSVEQSPYLQVTELGVLAAFAELGVLAAFAELGVLAA